MTRDELVAEARTYIDVRFKMHGRTKTGVDCIGLLIAVAKAFGQEIEDRLDYSMKNPFEVELNKHLHKHSNAARMSPLRHGEIVKFRQSIVPMHVGIITMDKEQPYVINSNLRKRKVVEEPLSLWAPLIMELREFKGVKD